VEVGGRVVIDVWGKFSIPAAGTNHNFIIGGEGEFSGWGLAMTSAHHTTDNMLEYLARFNDEVMATGHPEGVKIVRHDHATEMTNNKWRNGLKDLKIADESTIPYEKEGVGKAERSWGMMLPKARAMLIRCNGAGNLFLHAMVYARQVIKKNCDDVVRDAVVRWPIDRRCLHREPGCLIGGGSRSDFGFHIFIRDV